MTEQNRRTFLEFIGVASLGAATTGEAVATDGVQQGSVHDDWTPLDGDILVINNDDEAHEVSVTGQRSASSAAEFDPTVDVAPQSAGPDDCIATIGDVTVSTPGTYEIAVAVDGSQRATTVWSIPKPVGIASSRVPVPDTKRLLVTVDRDGEVEAIPEQI